MTIRFNPETLGSILRGPLAERRLKNRDVNVRCSCGNFSREDRILLLWPDIQQHDKDYPDHDLLVMEQNCGQGLF